jgi:putative ABC transport system permease protein
MARRFGLGVGDNIDITLATGLHQFKIVGLDSGQNYNGNIIHVPMATLQNLLLANDTVTGFFVKTTSKDHDLIDRTSTKIEDDLLLKGYVLEISIMYVMEELNIKSNQLLIDIMTGVGSLVVLITTIGLMSTLTMNVMERTKEIGMLRCLGARANQIRAVFGTEGMVMALVGWAMGIPIGYVVGRYVNGVILDTLGVEMTFLYPLNIVLLSLVVTLIITLIVIQGPLLRAVRFKPGEALRYQ